jgi:hypothetical protein
MRVLCTLQEVTVDGTRTIASPPRPTPIGGDLAVKNRLLGHVIDLAAAEARVLDLSALDLTNVGLVVIECLTAGKPFVLAVDQGPDVVHLPVSSTGRAFYISTASPTELEITNPDAATDISLAVSIFAKS